MNDDEVLDDRIGVAMTMAIVGSACGGSLIGVAMVGFGNVPADQPLLFAAFGVVVILAVTWLAGWYLPAKGETPAMTVPEDSDR